MGEKIYQSNIDSKKRYNDKLSTFQIDKNLHLEVKEYCKNNNLKVTEKLSKEIFSLPMYPELSMEKVNKVIDTINKF